MCTVSTAMKIIGNHGVALAYVVHLFIFLDPSSDLTFTSGDGTAENLFMLGE